MLQNVLLLQILMNNRTYRPTPIELQDEFGTAADVTYVLSEANDDRPLPKTMLTTDPVELMKAKKRKEKVVTHISTPERRKRVKQMFAGI